MATYQAMYERSIKDPEGFWGEVAEGFHWEKKWDKVLSYNYHRSKGPINVKWFEGGKTNITYNCLDRHLAKRANQTAIIWEGNEPGEDRVLTYQEMYEQATKFANVLKALGLKKGDRATIYMPMIPELAIAMLGCARIGAIHTRGLRRLLGRVLEGPRGGQHLLRHDHQRRHLPRCQAHLPEADRRRRAQGRREGRRQGAALRGGAARGRGQGHRLPHGGRPRPVVARGDGQGPRGLRPGVDGQRGHPVPALHLGLHRQAQGRGPHHRRLPVCTPP